MIKCSRKQSKAKLNRIQRWEKGKEERGEQSTFLSHLLPTLSPASRFISSLRRRRRERSVVGTPGSLLPIAARRRRRRLAMPIPWSLVEREYEIIRGVIRKINT